MNIQNSAEKKLNKIDEFVLLEKGLMEISQRSLTFWEKDVTATIKTAFHDIVTEADPAIETGLSRLIKETYPGAKVWGEENGGEYGPDSWGIDPIDGTIGFNSGGRDWCNSIVRMEKGRPVFSVIIVPIGNWGTEFYVAKEGKGAFLKEKLWNGDERVRQLRVTKTENLKQARFGMRQEDIWNLVRDGADNDDKLNSTQILKLSSATRGTVVSGSNSYTMAGLAAGRLSVAAAGPQPLWDVAMGDLMIREAGGIVTQLNSGPIDYMKNGLKHKTDFLAASNPQLHKLALTAMNLPSVK